MVIVRFDLRTFSFPSCDDIMVLNAERLVIFGNFCADQRYLDNHPLL
jgi:hypothetical protein